MSDSAMTGLTFPGMMELPGCTSGSASSPSPARGPDPNQRISFAIFIRLTAARAGGPQPYLDAFQGGEVGGRRYHVVAGLAQVHVIVRVDQLGAALAAQELGGAVGYHLVGVHVGGGAGGRLGDIDDELIV